MIDLIGDNYSLLQVMSRFGLSLGFGDKTVKEVCEMNNVDCQTFLVVVNFMAEGFSRMDGQCRRYFDTGPGRLSETGAYLFS